MSTRILQKFLEKATYYDHLFLENYQAYRRVKFNDLEKKADFKKKYEEAKDLRDHYAKAAHDLEKKD